MDTVSGQPRWPDVIGLLNETRNELSSQIQEVSTKFDRWVLPTESRLTLVEANQAAHTRQMGEYDALIHRNMDAIQVLQGKQEKDEAATKALQDAEEGAAQAKQLKLDWRHWVIGTLLTALLAVPSIEYAIHLLH